MIITDEIRKTITWTDNDDTDGDIRWMAKMVEEGWTLIDCRQSTIDKRKPVGRKAIWADRWYRFSLWFRSL